MLAILTWRTVSSMYPTTQCIMGIRVLALFLLPILALADDNVLDKAAADAVNSFSVDFFKEVLKQTEGNVVVSPVSVSTLLAMLHQGADGNTKTQLTSALQGEPEQTLGAYKKITQSLKNVSNETLLEFANGIFLNRGYEVRPKFKQHLKEDFLSEIAFSNFVEREQSAEQINKWVSEHTHDKIKQLVEPSMFSELTRAALVNAIYFKDTWETPFESDDTREETFYGDSEKKVPMMHSYESFKTGEFADLQAQWLELPFKGTRFSMVIVLPKEKNGLPNTLTKMTSEHFSTLRNNVKQGYPETVILSLPKFKISTTTKLIPILKLKIPDLFTEFANLTGVSEEKVFVSEAVQKAEIEADEKGASAAAATAFAIPVPHIGIINPEPDVVFNANHPFLVFIVDNVNGVILFAAQVLDP